MNEYKEKDPGLSDSWKAFIGMTLAAVIAFTVLAYILVLLIKEFGKVG